MRDKIFNDDTLAQIVQVQAIEINQLQAKLDAIKKAWGPFIGLNKELDELELEDLHSFSGDILIGDFRALDKLIGDGK